MGNGLDIRSNNGLLYLIVLRAAAIETSDRDGQQHSHAGASLIIIGLVIRACLTGLGE
jgi:hypothetical protein